MAYQDLSADTRVEFGSARDPQPVTLDMNLESAIRAIQDGARATAALEQIRDILADERDPAACMKRVARTALIALGLLLPSDVISAEDFPSLFAIERLMMFEKLAGE